MICILALIVFAVLAIFSAGYRPLAKEAFDCVFRRITFRKCRTNLDKKIKGKLVGRVMAKSTFFARFLHKHFELLSWIFIILLLSSFGYSVYSGHNYALYGNCYGPEENGGFCIYNALEGEQFSKIHDELEGEIVFPTIDNDPSLGPDNAKVVMIEFGCYMCPFSRQAEEVVKQVLKKYGTKIKFVFRDFPIKGNSDLHIAANCANAQNKFWEIHDLLFTEQDVCIESTGKQRQEKIQNIAEDAGLNMKKFNECMESAQYEKEVEQDFEDGLKAGVYGTPTFFINNRVIIGPKPLRAFEKIIEEELNE